MDNSRFGFGPPPPLISPEAALVKKNAETLERELIFGMIRHYQFYKEMRGRICLFDSKSGLYKQDFSVKKYNTLYQAVDAYWRRFDNNSNLTDTDFGIPTSLLVAYIIDWSNGKMIPPELCTKLAQELQYDDPLLRALTLNACRAMAQGFGFKAWLEQRSMDNAIRSLKYRMDKGELDLDALKEIYGQATNFSAPKKKRWENAGVIATGTEKWYRGMPTSLIPLNQAVGGGFRKGQAWLIAAAPGGGKTILANQLMWEFAEKGLNVVVVTTEQKPAALIPRTLSNACNIPFDDIQREKDRACDVNADEIDTPVIPLSYQNDPNFTSRISRVLQVLSTRVLFVNWTEDDKCSIVNDLAPEIEEIKNEAGWIPDVVIFDWLGGALEATKDPARVRFVYQEAADSFVEYCRNNNFAGIMFAQVNQVLAANKQRVTMPMLAEAKNIANRMHGFIGISGLMDNVDINAGELTNRLQSIQWLNVDKSRTGPGGLVKVKQEFKFQRFANFKDISVDPE